MSEKPEQIFKIGPTREHILSLLDYDPLTGIFLWKVTRGRHARPGSVAGSIKPSGYVMLKIDGELYKAHRVAWVIMTGVWPEHRIDHEDTDGGNNTWANLRPATHSQNIANSRRRSDNSTGIKGVAFQKDMGKYTAYINKDGVRYHLGSFDKIEDAKSAYAKRATELHGDYARSA